MAPNKFAFAQQVVASCTLLAYLYKDTSQLYGLGFGWKWQVGKALRGRHDKWRDKA